MAQFHKMKAMDRRPSGPEGGRRSSTRSDRPRRSLVSEPDTSSSRRSLKQTDGGRPSLARVDPARRSLTRPPLASTRRSLTPPDRTDQPYLTSPSDEKVSHISQLDQMPSIDARRSLSLTPPNDSSRPSLLRAESSSRLLRNPSGRFSRLPSRENSGEINTNEVNSALLPTSNSHLHLKNHRPTHINLSSTTTESASSFFVMITGHIESAKSNTSSCVSEQLYLRYALSYGPDWEIVHGVSMGLSQIGRQNLLSNINDNSYGGGGNVIAFNFPIEVSFQSTNPSGWPRLALSIYGFDFMGRDVLRGYASLMLPVTPGRHITYLKTYRPVSGSKLVQFVNWLMGTTPEYHDSKMSTRGEGRAVTRVVSADTTVKVNLHVTMKDLASFGYAS